MRLCSAISAPSSRSSPPARSRSGSSGRRARGKPLLRPNCSPWSRTPRYSLTHSMKKSSAASKASGTAARSPACGRRYARGNAGAHRRSSGGRAASTTRRKSTAGSRRSSRGSTARRTPARSSSSLTRRTSSPKKTPGSKSSRARGGGGTSSRSSSRNSRSRSRTAASSARSTTAGASSSSTAPSGHPSPKATVGSPAPTGSSRIARPTPTAPSTMTTALGSLLTALAALEDHRHLLMLMLGLSRRVTVSRAWRHAGGYHVVEVVLEV